MIRSEPKRAPLIVVLVVLALLGGWLATPETRSQALPGATLAPLLAKLKVQQDQMTANQTKIEAETADLKEELRQAKIYAGRGGGHR